MDGSGAANRALVSRMYQGCEGNHHIGGTVPRMRHATRLWITLEEEGATMVSSMEERRRHGVCGAGNGVEGGRGESTCQLSDLFLIYHHFTEAIRLGI